MDGIAGVIMTSTDTLGIIEVRWTIYKMGISSHNYLDIASAKPELQQIAGEQ